MGFESLFVVLLFFEVKFLFVRVGRIRDVRFEKRKGWFDRVRNLIK